MPLEIPPPEVHGDAKYTWKATAEQLPWKEGEAKVVLYRYEIFHEDGTKTVRTVTETDGVKETTEERKEVGGKAAVPQKKPIDPPKDLPEKATFDARRVVFTDEDERVTTTINYTVYTETGMCLCLSFGFLRKTVRTIDPST
mmetsp:Transcript_34352/g.110329  ORF Transcript_34352/g.110329 Transcript_34352/m.110329 type:complete len:142 (+) Transcript_34352:58-483(+)